MAGNKKNVVIWDRMCRDDRWRDAGMTRCVSSLSLSLCVFPVRPAAHSRSLVKLNYLNLPDTHDISPEVGRPASPPRCCCVYCKYCPIAFTQGILPLPKYSANHPFSLLISRLITSRLSVFLMMADWPTGQISTCSLKTIHPSWSHRS